MDEAMALRAAEGFLFIGDPHLSSRKPGRRKDTNFGKTVLGKIEFAINVANERKLIPVFLGDMFDRAVETDESLKTKLIRILRKAWTKPVSNVGNHDINNVVLTDGDSLALLAETGVIDVIAHSGAFETFQIGNKRIGLGGTPFGQTPPADVRGLFNGADTVVWLTHHDIAFENPYPGSMNPFEIVGCRMVVNGHMHLRKKPIKVGRTVWLNPGNITRQAIDAIDHVPAVWSLTVDGRFEPIPVPTPSDIFDLTGKLIDAISPGEAPKPGTPEGEDSVFVSLLSADTSMEMAKTQDGSVVLEEIVEKLERERAHTDVRHIVMDLHALAVNAAA
jgi:predicted phosphodiesterase